MKMPIFESRWTQLQNQIKETTVPFVSLLILGIQIRSYSQILLQANAIAACFLSFFVTGLSVVPLAMLCYRFKIFMYEEICQLLNCKFGCILIAFYTILTGFLFAVSSFLVILRIVVLLIAGDYYSRYFLLLVSYLIISIFAQAFDYAPFGPFGRHLIQEIFHEKFQLVTVQSLIPEKGSPASVLLCILMQLLTLVIYCFGGNIYYPPNLN